MIRGKLYWSCCHRQCLRKLFQDKDEFPTYGPNWTKYVRWSGGEGKDGDRNDHVQDF